MRALSSLVTLGSKGLRRVWLLFFDNLNESMGVHTIGATCKWLAVTGEALLYELLPAYKQD